jgi:hypothetical protein
MRSSSGGQINEQRKVLRHNNITATPRSSSVASRVSAGRANKIKNDSRTSINKEEIGSMGLQTSSRASQNLNNAITSASSSSNTTTTNRRPTAEVIKALQNVNKNSSNFKSTTISSGGYQALSNSSNSKSSSTTSTAILEDQENNTISKLMQYAKRFESRISETEKKVISYKELTSSQSRASIESHIKPQISNSIQDEQI